MEDAIELADSVGISTLRVPTVVLVEQGRRYHRVEG